MWFRRSCEMYLLGVSALVVQAAAEPPDLPRVEVLPDEIQARLEQRARENLRHPREVGGDPFALVVEILARWPSDVVTVAFQGGSPQLHAEIAEAASNWTQDAGVRFDFGHDATGGRYRGWSPSDGTYAADIRISFDRAGYWSLVGTDSIDPQIIDPGQPSLNLGGFRSPLDQDQRGTVVHEFGHALGFHHEHQSPEGGCDSEFRWEDDPDGTPGLYTRLAAPPNFWPKWKVDHNLRQLPSSDAYVATPHDPLSIMHYSFPAWMFRRGSASHCFAERNNELSPTDGEAMIAAYPPRDTAEFERTQESREKAVRGLLSVPNLPVERKRFLQGQLERMNP